MKFQDWLMFYGVPLSLVIIGALAIMFGFYLFFRCMVGIDFGWFGDVYCWSYLACVDNDKTANLQKTRDILQKKPQFVPFTANFREIDMDSNKFKHLFTKTRKPYESELWEAKNGVLACPNCKRLGIAVSDTADYQAHGHCLECKFSDQLGAFQSIGIDASLRVSGTRLGVECPLCGVGSELVVRDGRYGLFIGCNRYPSCKYLMNLREDESDNVLHV